MTAQRRKQLLDTSFARVVDLSSSLVRIPSPNPPGDVTAIATLLRDVLEAGGAKPQWLEPEQGHVNLLCTLESGRPGPHVVMNAHVDVFPVENAEAWSSDPYGGDVQDGKLRGRGVIDMKAGAAVFVEVLLAAVRALPRMQGKLSLLLVCDEEDFGPWGSKWLLDEFPDLRGDLLLSTEPSGLGLVRTAERGMVWAKVTFKTRGGHGAHPKRAPSALDLARQFMDSLGASLQGKSVPATDFVFPADQSAAYDLCVGPGASAHTQSTSLNFGKLTGGVKVNMQPANAELELDIRVPPGLTSAGMRRIVEEEAEKLSGTVEFTNFIEPNVSPPTNPYVRVFEDVVLGETSVRPVLGPSPGCSDARFWRVMGVPAAGYGPSPFSMGGTDEYCDLGELETVLAVHRGVVERVLFGAGERASS